MPLDNTHQHSSADIMRADDTNTPISPGGGTTPTLAEVLAAGNDPAGNLIALTPDGGYIELDAGDAGGLTLSAADGSAVGGTSTIYGGYSAVGGSQAKVEILGATADYGATVNISAGGAKAGSGKDGGDIVLTSGAGDGAGHDGLVLLNLPTADPEVVGALYEDPITHLVTVSQGP